MPQGSLIELYGLLKEELEKYEYEVKDFKQINYGVQFRILLDQLNNLMRIYQSKDGKIKADFSQFSKDNYSNKLKKDIQSILLHFTDLFNFENLKDQELELGLPIIGTDESGKGDYFGSLVTAGIFLNKNTVEELKEIGIRDSKKLSDKKNLEIASKVRKICKGHYKIIELIPETYNELYEQFIYENKNLNTLLAWGHAKAIEELLKVVRCDKAVSDQFADEKFIKEKLQERGKEIDLIQVHKAERNIAVAAASILARAKFLERLYGLRQKYNIEFPKGASNEVIEIGKVFVEKFGRKKLDQVAKIHFRTTEKIFEST